MTAGTHMDVGGVPVHAAEARLQTMTLLKTKNVHFATDPVRKRPYFITLIRRLKILKENHTLFMQRYKPT